VGMTQHAKHSNAPVLCLLGQVVQSPSRARCFVVLCGALRPGSWGPVAVSCRCFAVLCGLGASRRLMPCALRCFAGWVVGASRRLIPGPLRCFACWVTWSSRRLMPGALWCFAVLCGLWGGDSPPTAQPGKHRKAQGMRRRVAPMTPP